VKVLYLTTSYPSEESPIDGVFVREHARAQLSRPMIPGSFITVDALPVNGSGKVDYLALERLAAELHDRRGQEASAGLSSDEDLIDSLVELWRRLLERSDITADTDFFASGGHSMLGALVMQEVEGMAGVSLSLAELFEEPTPRGLAARVRNATAGEKHVNDIPEVKE